MSDFFNLLFKRPVSLGLTAVGLVLGVLAVIFLPGLAFLGWMQLALGVSFLVGHFEYRDPAHPKAKVYGNLVVGVFMAAVGIFILSFSFMNPADIY